jgi:glycosyltransferase involved in cell wall biosynthesis
MVYLCTKYRDKMTFDITIPVLNEEKTLNQQIRTLHTFLVKNFPEVEKWRIVIADNGSTDDTLMIAQTLSQELRGVTYINVPRKGVGLALKTSWSQTSAGMVGYMDLDLATDLSHFLEAYDAIANQGNDLVYATRLHPKSTVIGRTVKREFTSRVFNFILKNYLGVKFSDGMCGFKWLRREHFRPLMEGGAVSDGWFFSTELLTIAEWKGLKMYELPVKWTDDPDSRVKIGALARQYLKAMRVLKGRR